MNQHPEQQSSTRSPDGPPPGPHDQFPNGYAGPPPTGYPPAAGWADPYAPGPALQAWGQPNPFAGGTYAGGPFTGVPPGPYPVPYPMSHPGYSPAPRDRRPASVLAAAVLGYVVAGMLILLGIMLFSTSSLISSLNHYSDYGHSGLPGEFGFDGVLNVLAAGLLIGGAVAMCKRSVLGRLLFTVGAVISTAESIYWIARWGSQSDVTYVNFWALMFAAATVTALGLAWFGGGTAWLGRADAADG